MEQRYQVIIVGGGPVGVALAVDLGIRGVSCALVERHLTPQQIPKGQNLTQRSLEHFYFWGVVEELRAARVMPTGYPIGGITAYGDLMSDYWFAPVGREAVGAFYFQANERLPQYLTEKVLRRRLAGLPDVTTLFGWSAETIGQDDHGVRITISETHGPGERVLNAEYVVGCDGGRSIVREQTGIGRSGTDFDQRMLLAVIRSRDLHEGLKRFPERTTYRVLHPELNGVWQFFGRIDVGEETIPFGDVILREVREELGEDIKFRLGPILFVHHMGYDEDDGWVLNVVFDAEYISGDIKLSDEHISYEWVDRNLYKVPRKDFLPEDQEKYEAFKKYFDSLRAA